MICVAQLKNEEFEFFSGGFQVSQYFSKKSRQKRTVSKAIALVAIKQALYWTMLANSEQSHRVKHFNIYQSAFYPKES